MIEICDMLIFLKVSDSLRSLLCFAWGGGWIGVERKKCTSPGHKHGYGFRAFAYFGHIHKGSYFCQVELFYLLKGKNMQPSFWRKNLSWKTCLRSSGRTSGRSWHWAGLSNQLLAYLTTSGIPFPETELAWPLTETSRPSPRPFGVFPAKRRVPVSAGWQPRLCCCQNGSEEDGGVTSSK